MNGHVFTSHNSALALQPPVPMQPSRPTAAFPGSVLPNLSAPRLPLPPPRGDLSQQPNLQSYMDSQQASSEIVCFIDIWIRLFTFSKFRQTTTKLKDSLSVITN